MRRWRCEEGYSTCGGRKEGMCKTRDPAQKKMLQNTITTTPSRRARLRPLAYYASHQKAIPQGKKKRTEQEEKIPKKIAYTL
jgi:hypothetical protein